MFKEIVLTKLQGYVCYLKVWIVITKVQHRDDFLFHWLHSTPMQLLSIIYLKTFLKCFYQIYSKIIQIITIFNESKISKKTKTNYHSYSIPFPRLRIRVCWATIPRDPTWIYTFFFPCGLGWLDPSLSILLSGLSSPNSWSFSNLTQLKRVRGSLFRILFLFFLISRWWPRGFYSL